MAKPGLWDNIAAGAAEKLKTVRIGNDSFALTSIEDMDEVTKKTTATLGRAGVNASTNEIRPHFGVVWPAAVALSQHVQKYLHDKEESVSTLELGCGLALPSMVAARSGKARVTATDRHPLVPHFLSRNVAANGLADVAYQHLDWRQITPEDAPQEQTDLLMGSDLLYEPWQPGFLAAVIASLLKRTGVALIADPGRKLLDPFLTMLEASGLYCSETYLVQVPHGGVETDVLILEIRWVGASTSSGSEAAR